MRLETKNSSTISPINYYFSMKNILKFCPLLILLIFSACSSPKSPEFLRMENVQFKSMSFLEGPSVTLVGDAIFHNPNLLGAKVTAIDFDVFINEKKVTRIQEEVSATMKANAEFSLPLSFEIPLEKVIEDIQPTIGDIFKKKMVGYKLKGTINVGLGNLELKVPVEMEGEEEVKLM